MTKGDRAMRAKGFERNFRKSWVSSGSGPMVIGSGVSSERGLFDDGHDRGAREMRDFTAGIEQAPEFAISLKASGPQGRRGIRHRLHGEPHRAPTRRTVHGRSPPPVHSVLGFRRLSGDAAAWHRHRPLPDEAVLPLPPHVSGMERAERAVVTGPFLKYTASGLELRE
ncbi:hypothetical protein ACFW93_06490 [Streptomyces canus]|uniref:hypothetical protein n=1 Tax=Streptomyces canus TaxID=58343 RepID=UPI00369FA1F5